MDSDQLTAHDDGVACHLVGRSLPAIALPATDGREWRLDSLPARSVVFVHPGIGGAGEERMAEWSAIPGARGCTAEACAFRDEMAAFGGLAAELLGLSSQSAGEQRRHVEELSLPYPLLSDREMQLQRRLGLPTFELDGRAFYARATLIVAAGAIEAVLYPVCPPEGAAAQALAWLCAHRR